MACTVLSRYFPVTTEPGGEGSLGCTLLQVISSNERRGAQVFAVDLGQVLCRREWLVRTRALVPGSDETTIGVAPLTDRSRFPYGLRALRKEILRSRAVLAHGSTALPACATATLRSGV